MQFVCYLSTNFDVVLLMLWCQKYVSRRLTSTYFNLLFACKIFLFSLEGKITAVDQCAASVREVPSSIPRCDTNVQYTQTDMIGQNITPTTCTSWPMTLHNIAQSLEWIWKLTISLSLLSGTNTIQASKIALRKMHLQPKKEKCKQYYQLWFISRRLLGSVSVYKYIKTQNS